MSMPSLNTSEKRSFAELLKWHLIRGTRPNGGVAVLGRRWSRAEFADALGVAEDTVRKWSAGRGRPREFFSIERVLFGANPEFEDWRAELRSAYDADTVPGDVLIGGNVKIGEVLGDTQIVTGDSNTVMVSSTPLITGNEFSVGRDLHFPIPEKVLSSEQALGRISDAVRLNLGQLQLNMEQARSESSQFFRTTMIFSAIAFMIILCGVAFMLASLVAVGAVTTAASIIPQAAALLLFNKDKELRRTIESYHGHILESQRVLTMIDLAETMAETQAKDSVKEQIIFAVLKIIPTKETTA
jgi:hypothetical protein